MPLSLGKRAHGTFVVDVKNLLEKLKSFSLTLEIIFRFVSSKMDDTYLARHSNSTHCQPLFKRFPCIGKRLLSSRLSSNQIDAYHSILLDNLRFSDRKLLGCGSRVQESTDEDHGE